MDASVIIKFDSITAIVHVVCITIQVGILIYNGLTKEDPKPTYYNNPNNGGFQ
jgi:hypothetical protein